MTKAGTRIEVKGWDMDWNETWTRARIIRWRKDMGSRADIPGYHPVRDEDGCVRMVHESSFRVVDNRA